MTIIGKYGPPPEVIFDDVIIQLLDTDTAEEDLIEKIKKSNNTYFDDKDVNGYEVGITAVSVDDLTSSDSKDSSIIEESYLILLLLSLSFLFLIIIALIWRRKIRLRSDETYVTEDVIEDV